MSRRIVTKQTESNEPNKPGAPIDTYFDRVVKYIPSDIVAAWTAATGLINSASDVPQSTLLWIVFLVGVVLTPAWILKQTSEKRKPLAITQSLVSTVSFVVWVFALGGPFATLGFYRPLYGSLVLILYTLVSGLITPTED